MNLKQNKGYVGTDIAIAVIILLILIPTIMGMTFNANASKNATNVKAGATEVAVNTIEAAKGIGPGENLTISEVLSRLENMYTGTERGENASEIIVPTDKGTYKVNIQITDYATGKGEDVEENFVKTIKVTVEFKVRKVTVEFKVRNEVQSIEISTVIS